MANRPNPHRTRVNVRSERRGPKRTLHAVQRGSAPLPAHNLYVHGLTLRVCVRALKSSEERSKSRMVGIHTSGRLWVRLRAATFPAHPCLTALGTVGTDPAPRRISFSFLRVRRSRPVPRPACAVGSRLRTPPRHYSVGARRRRLSIAMKGLFHRASAGREPRRDIAYQPANHQPARRRRRPPCAKLSAHIPTSTLARTQASPSMGRSPTRMPKRIADRGPAANVSTETMLAGPAARHTATHTALPARLMSSAPPPAASRVAMSVQHTLGHSTHRSMLAACGSAPRPRLGGTRPLFLGPGQSRRATRGDWRGAISTSDGVFMSEMLTSVRA